MATNQRKSVCLLTPKAPGHLSTAMQPKKGPSATTTSMKVRQACNNTTQHKAKVQSETVFSFVLFLFFQELVHIFLLSPAVVVLRVIVRPLGSSLKITVMLSTRTTTQSLPWRMPRTCVRIWVSILLGVLQLSRSFTFSWQFFFGFVRKEATTRI